MPMISNRSRFLFLAFGVGLACAVVNLLTFLIPFVNLATSFGLMALLAVFLSYRRPDGWWLSVLVLMSPYLMLSAYWYLFLDDARQYVPFGMVASTWARGEIPIIMTTFAAGFLGAVLGRRRPKAPQAGA